jgi:predicted PurR-regulated permease PerM
MTSEPLHVEPRVTPAAPRSGIFSLAPHQRALRARIVIGVLAVGIAWASLPFLAGLLGAVVLAVLLAPLERRMAPRIGPRRAALLLAVASVLLLAAPIAFLLAWVIGHAPRMLEQVVASAAFARLPDLRIGPLDVGAQLAEGGRTVVAWGSRRLVGAAAGMTRTVLNLLLATVGLYYLLPDGPALWRRMRALIPFSAEGADHLAE